MAEQLPLGLAQTAGAAGASDFIISSANAAAVGLVNGWPDWPASTVAPALLLLGPPGSGKTHLARIWQAQAAATYQDWCTDLPAIGRAAVLDRCDAWAADDQTGLFHLLNQAKEQNFPLLLCAAKPVEQWGLTLPDLLSRLKALPVAQLNDPDDDLLAALFGRALSDRGLQISPEVLGYCLPRLPRNAAELLAMAGELDTFALASAKGLTLPVVRTFFAQQTELPLP